jgi:hypothetical protein
MAKGCGAKIERSEGSSFLELCGSVGEYAKSTRDVIPPLRNPLFRARTVSVCLQTAYGVVLEVAWIVAQYDLALEVVQMEFRRPTYVPGMGPN